MAVRFHELPLTVFPEEAQPYIGRLNRELEDLFGLEGTLKTQATARRSDLSIARTAAGQVQADRVLNLTEVVVSGSTATGASHNLFSTTHPDTVTASPVKGDMIVANSTPAWTRLPGGDTATKQLLEYQSSNIPGWTTLTYEKSICVESPTASEDLTIWHTPENIEVTEVRGVLQGGSVTGVSFDVKWAADRSAAGTSLLDAGAGLTNATVGQTFTLGSTASNRRPTANSYIWLETNSGGGTGTMHVSLKHKRVV